MDQASVNATSGYRQHCMLDVPPQRILLTFLAARDLEGTNFGLAATVDLQPKCSMPRLVCIRLAPGASEGFSVEFRLPIVELIRSHYASVMEGATESVATNNTSVGRESRHRGRSPSLRLAHGGISKPCKRPARADPLRELELGRGERDAPIEVGLVSALARSRGVTCPPTTRPNTRATRAPVNDVSTSIARHSRELLRWKMVLPRGAGHDRFAFRFTRRFDRARDAVFSVANGGGRPRRGRVNPVEVEISSRTRARRRPPVRIVRGRQRARS